MRAHFLEDILEITGYKLTSSNQVDDYGQEKLWKTQKQLVPRKRKNQITTLVEVCSCVILIRQLKLMAIALSCLLEVAIFDPFAYDWVGLACVLSQAGLIRKFS